jgi:aspartate aminotransferase-like enzyme
MIWTGLIWFRIGTMGTFRFHKMLRSSLVAAELVASQEGLSSRELVTRLIVCIEEFE